MLMSNRRNEPLSDIRVSATLTPKSSSLSASFTLETLQHRFAWLIAPGKATLSMATLHGEVVKTVEVEIDVLLQKNPARPLPIRLECWHVDQMMVFFVDGERVAELPYNFSPEERLR